MLNTITDYGMVYDNDDFDFGLNFGFNFNKHGAAIHDNNTTETEKEYQFFEPKVFAPGWEAEIASPESGYSLLKTSKEESFEELLKNKTKPIVFIGKNIYEEMMEMAKYAADSNKSEVAAFFIYVPLNDFSPHWEVVGWFMTGQTATGGEVEMDGLDYPRYMDFLTENYPELMKRAKIGHWHSHVYMDTFWSGTDKKQHYDKSQLGLLKGDRIFVVVNANRKIKAKYIQYAPFLFEVDDINIGLSFNNPGYLDPVTRDRKKEIHDMVDSLIVKRAPAYKAWYGYGNTNNFSQKKQQSTKPVHRFDYKGKPVQPLGMDFSKPKSAKTTDLSVISVSSLAGQMEAEQALDFVDYIQNKLPKQYKENVEWILKKAASFLKSTTEDIELSEMAKSILEDHNSGISTIDLNEAVYPEDVFGKTSIDKVSTETKEVATCLLKIITSDLAEKEGLIDAVEFEGAEQEMISVLNNPEYITEFIELNMETIAIYLSNIAALYTLHLHLQNEDISLQGGVYSFSEEMSKHGYMECNFTKEEIYKLTIMMEKNLDFGKAGFKLNEFLTLLDVG